MANVTGWGRGTWSEGSWGEALPVTVSGISTSINIGSVTVAIGQQIDVTGLSAQVLIGEETPVIDVTTIATGLDIQTSLGAVQALSLSGIQAQTNVGTVDIQAGGNVFVNVAEHNLQTAVGQAIEIITVDVFVDGVSTQVSIGEEIPVGNAIVSVTGQSLTTAIGDVDAVSKIQVTGLSASVTIGSATPQANADVVVTGSSLTTNIGTVQVTAWAEVNTGVNVTWTPVDLAA